MSGERVDTWEMVVVHRYFRREFALAAGLVRGVAAGDRVRASRVAEHLALTTDGLHHHHSGEDDLLWPVLLQRVSLHTDLVKRMEAQHEALAALLTRVDELLPRWRQRADVETRDELADVLARSSALLEEHLAEEEKQILPLVSEHLTHAEWEALGKRGKDSLPKDSRGFVILGMILQDATPDERRRFIKLLPPPVRLIWRVSGQRAYRRAVAELYGTAAAA